MKLIISTLSFLFHTIKYINPRFLYCVIFHGVSREQKYFMSPFGIGGGYNKTGYWCEKCKNLYCSKMS
jgi:hypothetical protein